MITRILIFAIIIAVIVAIKYGRKLIKTEKVDAVFGNPERATGGAHWAIVGSSVILLAWLYYSWDIAKSFSQNLLMNFVRLQKLMIHYFH